MAKKESWILFGEGKTEAVFLQHIRDIYLGNSHPVVCKVKAGSGGSPRQVVNALIKRHLQIGAYKRALVLLDQDRGTDEIPNTWLEKYRITLVVSKPVCLEGMLLTMLGERLQHGRACTAQQAKSQFRRAVLDTDQGSQIQKRFRQKLPEALPRTVLDYARNQAESLQEILNWLQ